MIHFIFFYFFYFFFFLRQLVPSPLSAHALTGHTALLSVQSEPIGSLDKQVGYFYFYVWITFSFIFFYFLLFSIVATLFSIATPCASGLGVEGGHRIAIGCWRAAGRGPANYAIDGLPFSRLGRRQKRAPNGHENQGRPKHKAIPLLDPHRGAKKREKKISKRQKAANQ